jgi:hypothetical protein
MPVLPLPELSGPWLDFLSEDDRKLVLFLLSHHALEPALSSTWIVDVRLRGFSEPSAPLLPGVITLEISDGELRDAHRALERLEAGQYCILLRNIIQTLPDYRSFIASALDKLALGGFLIIMVPHQFLFERKLQPPSRYNRAHLRFYTPGMLLAEVEEALDPCRYRVRFLADYDSDFDYAAALDAVPRGGHNIVLCLQRIASPPWREAMEKQESQSGVYTQPSRFLQPYDGEVTAYRVVAPDDNEINRLIILKLDHRGDFMMAMPAFQILRKAFRSAEITLVCGSWNRQEAVSLDFFDGVIAFDFFPEDVSARWSSEAQEDLQERFAELTAGERYDLAIDLRLYEDTRELLHLIDARHKAGFDPYDTFPWLTISLNLLVPTRDGRAEQGVMPATKFHTRSGDHQVFAIIFPEGRKLTGNETLVWGPYADLTIGRYEFEVLIEPLIECFELSYDLASNQGQNILDAGLLRIERDRFPRITLYILEPIKAFEFRLRPARSGLLPPFRFIGLRYKRRGAYVGTHQRESMALLAHLVALRLQVPYSVEQV